MAKKVLTKGRGKKKQVISKRKKGHKNTTDSGLRTIKHGTWHY